MLDLLHTRDKIDYKWRQAQFEKISIKFTKILVSFLSSRDKIFLSREPCSKIVPMLLIDTVEIILSKKLIRINFIQ